MRHLRLLRNLLVEAERYWRERFVAWGADVDKRSKAGEFGKWPWQQHYGLWPWQRKRKKR